MNKRNHFSLHDIVIIGTMAAVCFVVTYFIKIEIPTPSGITMLKIANGFCLLSGILFGGLRGGLAAGIGSMLYDLLDPKFVSEAPFTFVFFFLMAYICGKISHSNNKKGASFKLNILATFCGAFSYLILHISKNIILLIVAGSNINAAFVAVMPKIVTSSINAFVGILIALILYPLMQGSVKRFVR